MLSKYYFPCIRTACVFDFVCIICGLYSHRRRHAAESLLRGMPSPSSSSSSATSSGGLLGDGNKTVVFVNAIATARRVSATLELLGIAAKPLHAEMQQRQRLKVFIVVPCKWIG